MWIEGKRAASPHFAHGLQKKGFTIDIASNGNEALARFSDIDPDLVVINAASLRTSGKRIARSMRSSAQRVPILIILDTNHGPINDPNVDVVLTLPFTLRKILNRIRLLSPGTSNNMLHKGAIRLDLERKRVRCHGREVSLTPRLTQILKNFLENPGVVLEREDLFRRVWNTEYTLDTRTLDVHISWLRQAIEEDPRRPRFIKTIRGVGYRLDL